MKPFVARATWITFLLLLGWLALAHTTISSQLSDFMPAGDKVEQELMEQLRTGAAARLLLVGIEGESPERVAELSARLAARLQATGHFRRIINGPQAVDEREQELLFHYRYLLAPTTSGAFTTEALHDALQERLDELNSPFSFDKANIPADPTGASRIQRNSWQQEGSPQLRFGVWFAKEAELALLLAETRAEGFDLDGQEQALRAIDDAFNGLKAADQHLKVTGAGLFAVKSRELIRNDSQMMSILASAAMALLVLIAYRSPRAMLITALPLVFAMAFATVVTGALFGSVHGITLAFGITLIGVAGDYPLHLLSHVGPGVTPTQALRNIWPTMRLGVLTTCAGYLAIAVTDFTGVAQLGIFGATGLLAAALFTRYALPLFVPGDVHPRLLPEHNVPQLPRAAVFVTALALLALFFIRPPIWEDELSALSPLPADLVEQDRTLRSLIGAPDTGHVVLVRGADAETVLQRCEILARDLSEPMAKGWLVGWDGACRYLPSMQLQRERQKALPGSEELQPRLIRASEGLPFRAGVFQPFVEDIESSRGLALLTPTDLVGTAYGARIETLLQEREGQWLGLINLRGVSDSVQLSTALQPHAEWAGYINTKERANGVLRHFRLEALGNLLWGAALVLVLLIFSLRSPQRALRVILPVTLALGVDLIALTLLGERLSLFHLVALLLVVGIAIDYSLFFDRTEADLHSRRSTEHAVTLCAVSTAGAFGILATSQIPVLRAIGLTVFIGIIANYGFARLLSARSACGGVRD